LRRLAVGDRLGWEALTQQEAEQDARPVDYAHKITVALDALQYAAYHSATDHDSYAANEALAALLDALAVAVRERDQARDALRLLREACDTLVLTWVCEECGWDTTLPVPGFGGDGRYHYPCGVYACGPLRARRAALAGRQT
jgi:hypothetical protein